LWRPPGIIKDPYRFSEIESIEINHIRHVSLDIEDVTEFGIKVSFRARDRFDYFVLEAGLI
jgi:hypothetical protein